MCVAREEIFGPVAVVIPFETSKKLSTWLTTLSTVLAVRVRTEHRTRDPCSSLCTHRPYVGYTYNQIPEALLNFGGYKQSGIGRETDKMVLNHYTQCKNILINLNEGPSGFYPA